MSNKINSSRFKVKYLIDKGYQSSVIPVGAGQMWLTKKWVHFLRANCMNSIQETETI